MGFFTTHLVVSTEALCSPACTFEGWRKKSWRKKRWIKRSREKKVSGETQRSKQAFLKENKPAKQTPERLERERQRFPFGACTVLIQHSRLSAENKHFRPQLPLCSSPYLTGDVTQMPLASNAAVLAGDREMLVRCAPSQPGLAVGLP